MSSTQLKWQIEVAAGSSTDLEQARALGLWDAAQEEKLRVLVGCLKHWQKAVNLVASSTLDQIWMRHVADSSQLVPLAGKALTWVDLGSGSGFPGIVAAILRGQNGACCTHLVESDQRKCGFLRHVSRETAINVIIHNARIEEFLQNPPANIDVISARALAPLDKLLHFSSNLLLKGATALFLKGQDVDAELTRTAIDSRFVVEKIQSQTNHASRILRVGVKEGVALRL